MELLEKAAKAFEEGQNPFASDWLTENNVTSDECFTLSEQISVLIKGYLASKPEDQMLLIALGAVYGEPGVDLDMMRANLKLAFAAKRAGAVGGGT